MSHTPYVDLGRDLLEDSEDTAYARFTGEWSPDEKEDATGWETFTVMVHGQEACDAIEVTWEDLRRILDAR